MLAQSVKINATNNSTNSPTQTSGANSNKPLLSINKRTTVSSPQHTETGKESSQQGFDLLDSSQNEPECDTDKDSNFNKNRKELRDEQKDKNDLKKKNEVFNSNFQFGTQSNQSDLISAALAAAASTVAAYSNSNNNNNSNNNSNHNLNSNKIYQQNELENSNNANFNNLHYFNSLLSQQNPFFIQQIHQALASIKHNMEGQQQQQQQQHSSSSSSSASSSTASSLINKSDLNLPEQQQQQLQQQETPRISLPIDSNYPYVSKIKSNRHLRHHSHKHHMHHHHHAGAHSNYHSRRLKVQIDPEDSRANSSSAYSLTSSSSSSSSSPSSSSSSVSSESNPSSPSQSPQPIQQQTTTSAFSKTINKQLPQSISVPKLISQNHQQHHNHHPAVYSSLSPPTLAQCTSMPNTPQYDSSLNHHFFSQSLQSSRLIKSNGSNSSIHSLSTPTNQSASYIVAPVQSSSSNSSISNEVKQKLKNCILQKLNGSQSNINSIKPTIPLQQQQQTQQQGVSNESANNFKLNFNPTTQIQLNRQKNCDTNSLAVYNNITPNQNIQSLIDDDHMLRRTTSEPNLKVKSALKDRLLEKRNLVNPFMINKRPKLLQPASSGSKQTSTSPLAYPTPTSPVLNNQKQDQSNAILAAVAAATAAAVAAVSQQNTSSNNLNLIAQQIALQQHALAQNPLAQAVLSSQMNQAQETVKLPSSLSYPSISNYPKSNKYENKNSLVSSSPKFGHIVHVEEENEILLENELKNAAKQNENVVKSQNLYYSNEDMDCVNTDVNFSPSANRPLGRATSFQYQHRHQKYFNYINSQNNNPSSISQAHLQNANNHPRLNEIRQQHKQEQQQQVLQNNTPDLEELNRLQKFSTNKSSYFSDPYLLRSFEIATIGSTSNINKPSVGVAQHSNENKFLNLNEKSNSCFTKQEFTNPTEVSLNQLGEEKSYRYTTGLVYDSIMLKHECTCLNPANHLETPDRIKSIWSRIKSLELDQECEVVPAKLATIGDLLNCHNEQYSLIFGSDLEQRPKLPKEYLQMYMMNVCLAQCQGFALTYDQDNSWNEEYTPLACRAAIGSTYEMANLVSNGKLKNGFAIVRPPGSHAEYNKPLGFCYFNTVAIVAKMLKKNLSLERILIVDWDVHHGNGTQQMTYNDPNILYISLHRHDNGNFFPGTGSVDECGQDAGLGKNVNIAWNGKPGTAMGDAEYLAAFRCVVMPIAKAFNPQIVLVSSGFDATEQHPKELGGYRVSPVCFAYMTKKLMTLADGKVVLALEGGYDIKSLCDCSEMCINALMNKQIPSFSNQTLDALPNSSAIQDLENVIEIQKKYWPNIQENSKYVRMSHNQYISFYNE